MALGCCRDSRDRNTEEVGGTLGFEKGRWLLWAEATKQIGTMELQRAASKSRSEVASGV